jgi:hypothetical protein
MVKAIFIDYFLQVLFSIGLVVAAGLIIGLINVAVYRLLGGVSKKVCVATGIIGTPIHELGHALFCLIFGHKITKMKLFSPDPDSGTLGYVSHTYNKRNIYHQIGNFFIGIGPIISGGLVITLIMYLAVPAVLTGVTNSISGINLNSFSGVVNNIYDILYIVLFNPNNLSNFAWWIFIIVCSSIALHMAISVPDIRCSIQGLIYILGTMLVVNIIIGIISLGALDLITDFILGISSYLIALLGICLIMSLIILCLALIFRIIRKILFKV